MYAHRLAFNNARTNMRGRNKNFHDLFTVLKRRKTTCTNGEGYKLSCHWSPQSQHGRNVFLRPENPVCMHPKGHLMVRVIVCCVCVWDYHLFYFFLVLFFSYLLWVLLLYYLLSHNCNRSMTNYYCFCFYLSDLSENIYFCYYKPLKRINLKRTNETVRMFDFCAFLHIKSVLVYCLLLTFLNET